MDNDRPLVQAALFADRVLREEDGVLSAIRIIDRVTVNEKPEEGQRSAIEVRLLFAVKSGSVEGDQTFRVRHRDPSGKYGKLDKEWPVSLKGGGDGANLVITLILELKEYGTHWFDLEWQGHVLTSVPLTIVQGWEEANPQ